MLPQQALPLKHPIRAYVAQDRQARMQAHKQLHPQQLLSQGSIPLLPLAEVAAAAKHETRASGSTISSGSKPTSSTDNECAGGSNPGQLLFCSKHWLLQIDPSTGVGTSDRWPVVFLQIDYVAAIFNTWSLYQLLCCTYLPVMSSTHSGCIIPRCR
jgi:hypothetical protein